MAPTLSQPKVLKKGKVNPLTVGWLNPYIPEVDGSNPLPPTNYERGLEDISLASNPFFIVFLMIFRPIWQDNKQGKNVLPFS
jgi:hypothetical protein